MSKIGRRPIEIPQGVEVTVEKDLVRLKGAKGESTVSLLPFVSVEVKDSTVHCSIEKSHKQARSNWGTCASLIENAIAGVSQGFEKKLEIEGVGYRVSQEGANLVLNLGYSHPIKVEAPAGITLKVEEGNSILISGVEKQQVGQVAAEIRKLRKPEPYKGKGIRYSGEIIRRKAGKKVGSE
ncbi:MAG: 50S ribosomal protein L6 [Candidatus Harrisonbacteria bacterium]|nr:50S ribosomal protein L6 [Candidatus Harrisonbacteria bacterium]